MAGTPTFVLTDTHKALEAVLKDSAGQRIDLTGWEVRLFALSRGNSDRPTSNPGEVVWNGVLGVLTNPTQGVVQFQGLGGILDIASEQTDAYDFQIRGTSPSPVRVSWSWPRGEFSAVRPIS